VGPSLSRSGGRGAIIIHSLDHALAAAALGSPLVLRSAVGAGGFAGVGWFAALVEAVMARHPDLAVTFILDCADEVGTAMAALRRGLTHLRFSGPAAVAAKLAALGAILDEDDRPALDLLGRADPEGACRAWLGR
jgi:hypothetical protein